MQSGGFILSPHPTSLGRECTLSSNCSVWPPGKCSEMCIISREFVCSYDFVSQLSEQPESPLGNHTRCDQRCPDSGVRPVFRRRSDGKVLGWPLDTDPTLGPALCLSFGSGTQPFVQSGWEGSERQRPGLPGSLMLRAAGISGRIFISRALIHTPLPGMLSLPTVPLLPRSLGPS